MTAVVPFAPMPDTVPGPVKHVVLGVNGGPTDPLVIKLGCELARERHASLTAVHVVEVDWSHDLSEDVSSGNEAAAAVLDRAEAIAEKLQVPLATSLLQARDVGAALVDEASEQEADLMVLGLPYRKKFGGDFAIGRTVPYVLQNAPFGVLVVREPIARSEARGREPLAAVGAGLGARDRL
jgi:nucleotide-binding universal stress UspA family protein